MATKAKQKIPVFVGTIDTRNPEVYGGPRISVGNTEQEALEDMAEFLEMHDDDQEIQDALKEGDIRGALDIAEVNDVIRGWSISEEGGHFVEAPEPPTRKHVRAMHEMLVEEKGLLREWADMIENYVNGVDPGNAGVGLPAVDNLRFRADEINRLIEEGLPKKFRKQEGERK
jgi:predicted RNase H-like HicB family nuclease